MPKVSTMSDALYNTLNNLALTTPDIECFDVFSEGRSAGLTIEHSSIQPLLDNLQAWESTIEVSHIDTAEVAWDSPLINVYVRKS